MNKKRYIQILLITLLISAPAYAAKLVATGQIAFLKSIKIEEKKKLNFGKLEVPSTGIWVGVTPLGQPEGTGNFIDTADVSQGIYVIYGSNNQTINIKASSLNTYPFMDYYEISGKYNNGGIVQLMNGVANLAAPGNGKDLQLGARLKISQGVQEGNYSPAFVIEVNYD